MTIDERIESIYEEIVGIRRNLHQTPELGFAEHETIKKIKGYLDIWQIPYEHVMETAIVATIEGSEPGKTVAIRADIDALPLTEDNDLPYKSQNDGCMHACGHDVHTAMALGVGKVFSDTKSDWKGTVKLLFEPAEETDGGALPMVEAGAMKGVDHVLGIHVMPYYDAGVVELKYGQMNASSDALQIVVKGKSGHAAYPHMAVDAVVVSSHIVTALQQIVSRNINPTDAVVVTIGTIHGGTKHNNIAETVTMEGTLRTLSEASRKLAKERIRSIVSGVAESMDAEAEVTINEGYCVLENDDRVVDVVKRVAIGNLGQDHVKMKAAPSMGVDDMAYFLQKAPGAYIHLGCGNASKGITASLHSTDFNVDESCMKTGMMTFLKSSLALLGGAFSE